MDSFNFLQRTYTTVKKKLTKILAISRKVPFKATGTLSHHEGALGNNFLNILEPEKCKTYSKIPNNSKDS